MPKGMVMKKLLFAVLALSGPASAQQVHIESFTSSGQQAFEILVPTVRSEVATSIGRERPHSQALEQDGRNVEFGEPSAASPSTPFVPAKAALHVPNWMRVGLPTFDPSPEIRRAGQATPGCGEVDYFPLHGIGSEAQYRRRLYFQEIVSAACAAGVPVRLFDALVAQESRYRPYARSHAGAMGLTQLMPGTADDLGVVDPWDLQQNLAGGARYLRMQLDRFGKWELALAAYNAGPGRVEQYNGIPPFRETRAYVSTIMRSVQQGNTVHRAASAMPPGNPFRKVRLARFVRPSEIPED